MIPKLTDELMLDSSLRARGVFAHAFNGLTTPDQRKQRFRDAIQCAGAGLLIGNWNGMERTLGMAFQFVYGETL